MRTIELTSKNIGVVYGKLKKFFNNPKYGYISFHNFDCGYKNIKPYSGIKKDITVDIIEIDYDLINKQPYIRINFQKDVSGTVIDIGAKLILKGNEIITRKKWYSHFDNNYIYSVYRLCKLEENDITEIEERRNLELDYARLLGKL